ncbi:MAG: hypothetical protein GF393_12735 [Armatimonadia bacterium]|nr:hypothetical protein [Armatimonadia bacterium]
MRLLPIALAVGLLAASGFSATIYVPDDYPTIQGAIDAAVSGDTVIVRPGTYVECIDFSGKEIHLRSEDGPDTTIIDGGQWKSVVTFQSGEGRDAILEGFMIQNGAGNNHPVIPNRLCGGGIYCESSSPTIRDNIITSNRLSGTYGSSTGGGVYCENSAPLIARNVIVNNEVYCDSTYAAALGGGICAMGLDGGPLVVNNVIARNCARAGWGDASGGGIYSTDDSQVLCCTIVFNTTTGWDGHATGGGIWNDGAITVSNSILWGNESDDYRWDQMMLTSGTVSYCNVEGGWQGAGNINADPLFVDPYQNDYHLQQDPCQPGVTNPCVDAGDPGSSTFSGTTRTDGIQDAGLIDQGYHYPVDLGPDLEITLLDFTPSSLNPNALLQINYTVENKGLLPCGLPTSIGFVLSPDSKIETSDLLLGSDQVPDLNPGESHSNMLSICCGDNPGTWTLGGYADWTDAIFEPLSEDNGYDAGTVIVNSLWPDRPTVSQQVSETIHFFLRAGQSFDRRYYFLLGSLSGTTPGHPLPGGGILPLNRDVFSDFILRYYNYPVFADFRGLLDLSGEAYAHCDTGTFVKVLPVGTTMHFAFTTEFPYDFQSNPVAVEVVP